MDCANTSSDESIFHEQSSKLYRLCDVEKKGFILLNDLRAIEDYMPEADYVKMRKEVGRKAVDEYTFYSILKQVIQSSIDQHSAPGSAKRDDPDEIFTYQTNLAEELGEFQKEKIVDHHLENILKEGLYDMRSLEVQQPKGPRSEEDIPVYINNAIYRPIQPETGSKTTSLAEELSQVKPVEKEDELETPERIFKVVFVGDSAVGKTCFLHRFCHNRFKPLFNATIGVDFTVKTLRIAQNRVIAMQLWDTAGQERFRSITKQYFRKADGVVLMFDVTSEQSFLNVRNWIDSVKLGVDESTVMCLVGNKVDLFGNDTSRSYVCKAGEKLAKEFEMPFFETSAYTGFGIDDCMKQMAERLKKREDDHLEEALRLELLDSTKKKRSWCCA